MSDTPALHAPRQSLAARACSLSDGGLVVVCAPPGFGKTFLLNSIASAGLGDFLDGRSSSDALPTLIDDVRRDSLASLLPVLDEAMHRGRPLILATRDGAIASELSFLHAGRCRFLDEDKLRLEADEVARLFGRKADDPLVADILSLTRGWPLAVRLLQNEQVDGRIRFPELPPRTAASLADYFDGLGDFLPVDELLQIHDLLDLEEIPVALVHSAFSGERVNQTLREMARRGAFVREWLDEAPRFRVEPLFARWARWRTAGATIGPECGEKALALARHGSIRPALRLALRSRSPQMLAQLTRQVGGIRMPMTLGFEAADPMRQIDSTESGNDHDLLISRIYLALQEGHVGDARDLLGNLDALRAPPPPAAAMRRDLIAFAIALYESRFIAPSAISEMEERHAAQLSCDAVARAMVQQLRASAFYHLGDYDSAYGAARHVMELCDGLDAPLLVHYSKFYVALVEFKTGHLARAAALLETVVSLSQRDLGRTNPQAAQAALMLARICIERLDRERALEMLADYSAAGEPHTHWRDATELVLAAMAWLARETGDIEAALAPLDLRIESCEREARWSCVQSAALLKAELLLTSRRIEAAAEAAATAARASQRSGLAVETAPDLQLRLLEKRLATERGEASLHEADSTALAERIHQRGDIFARLGLLALQYRSHVLQGREREADETLLALIRLAARHGMAATFADEWRRSEADMATRIDTLDLGSQEQQFVQTVRPDYKGATGVESLPCQLSPRERQVLDFLSDGLSSKEMARSLNISIGTVKGYRRKLYEKLNIYKRSEAVTAARTFRAGKAAAS